jgi:hypothetical protein
MRSRLAKKIVKKAAAGTTTYSAGKVKRAQDFVKTREKRNSKKK